MEKFHISLDAWQDRLDSRWKQLPAPQKRRIVLYSFAVYLLTTIAIILQVIYEMGRAPNNLGIEHISNKVAKQQSTATEGTTIQKLKTDNDERRQKEEGKLSGQ